MLYIPQGRPEYHGLRRWDNWDTEVTENIDWMEVYELQLLHYGNKNWPCNQDGITRKKMTRSWVTRWFIPQWLNPRWLKLLNVKWLWLSPKWLRLHLKWLQWLTSKWLQWLTAKWLQWLTLKWLRRHTPKWLPTTHLWLRHTPGFTDTPNWLQWRTLDCSDSMQTILSLSELPLRDVAVNISFCWLFVLAICSVVCLLSEWVSDT